jgi:hypothetical protein
MSLKNTGSRLMRFRNIDLQRNIGNDDIEEKQGIFE